MRGNNKDHPDRTREEIIEFIKLVEQLCRVGRDLCGKDGVVSMTGLITRC